MDLLRRLWIYQAERFPLIRHGPLIALFAGAGVTLSAALAGRPLAGLGQYLVAGTVALLLFLQLRIADEVKDAEDDRRFRPERPVPRGLVSLRLLIGLGGVAALTQAVLAASQTPALLAVLALVWLWMALMTAEFFCRSWLRAHAVATLLSHMAIMPLIDLFITACEWLPAGGMPPPALGPFLLLSFANGCVLELGRKIWPAARERPGVETYSALWGPRRALGWWCLCLLVALGLTLWVGGQAGAFWIVAAIAGSALLPALPAIRRYALAGEGKIELSAGLWVLGSYLSIGVGPLLAGKGM